MLGRDLEPPEGTYMPFYLLADLASTSVNLCFHHIINNVVLTYLEKEMTTNSSILAGKIPYTGEPDGL